ncbi:S-adenosylmethionine:tRNA ribosyltransferase-isomerase [Salsipaludibacter albus]|uniref:S-adenosylmethionine:tRNA ribosyltransferase-isomerase n=1 Tax=Salsipaludibacter albus TaxID=2849650 RepID=UPI001EE4E766|nr:S-adenosylmethionine:tRNA ribosyltransferase-isomerase [Salsipaludibacter albus]MBY5161528.1 S-adenosylmethionine:tRNA ribosyltransferase-isomerase [Salsipaludibacter albus]
MSARTTLAAPAPVSFHLPPGREATGPPEERGVARDRVRLLVARAGLVSHTRFDRIGEHLTPGDLLVVNTTPTMPAALDGTRGDDRVVVHLSTRHADHWIVELRLPDGSGPVLDATPGTEVRLDHGGTVTLRAADGRPTTGGQRLWSADVDVPGPLTDHLARHGRPITYGHAPRRWPLAAYQTTFARLAPPAGGRDPVSGGASAEMASAGRPFSPLLVTELVSRGVTLAPVTLHAGVSSQDHDEPPRPEPWAVPETTADLVNRARAAGRRVVAVGTTVTRALESAADDRGMVRPGRGWTDLVLGPDRPARVVSGLVTGWHPPGASHLLLLEAVAGRDLVARAYAAALAGPYLWHEFGDSCLLLSD